MKKILVFTLICTAHLINSNITASFSSNAEALEHNRSSSSVVTAKAVAKSKDEVFEELVKLRFLQSDGVYMELANLEIISSYATVQAFPKLIYPDNALGTGIRNEIRKSKDETLHFIKLYLKPNLACAGIASIMQEAHGHTLINIELDGIFLEQDRLFYSYRGRKMDTRKSHCESRFSQLKLFADCLPKLQIITINVPSGLEGYLPREFGSSTGRFVLESYTDSGSQKKLTFTREVSKTDVKLGPINERDSTSGDNS
ncbi:MAG: hypothetical protein NT128_00655 [Proteobacteria bacterium]|nr:hypothetical protein [Pseudomonadota bacterium]